jgi:hypothetical protein
MCCPQSDRARCAGDIRRACLTDWSRSSGGDVTQRNRRLFDTCRRCLNTRFCGRCFMSTSKYLDNGYCGATHDISDMESSSCTAKESVTPRFNEEDDEKRILEVSGRELLCNLMNSDYKNTVTLYNELLIQYFKITT